MLGRQLADGVERVAAARAGPVLDIELDFVARQVCRQGAVVAVRRLGAQDDRRRRVAASIFSQKFRRISDFLARQFRPPHRHGRAPLAAVEQGGQLRRRQRDPAARRRGRPNELALLQPLGQHAQADPIVPDQLD